KRKDVADRQVVYEETKRFLKEKYGIECLGLLGFENAYALAMRRDAARELGITTIADLKRHAPRLSIAGDLQFFERPEWTHVRDRYGLSFKEARPMDPSLMY